MGALVTIFLRGLLRVLMAAAGLGAGLLAMAGLHNLLPRIASVFYRLAKVTVRLPTGPVPASWPSIIQHRVPLTSRLSGEARDRLCRLIQLFVKEVPIEGCNGLDVTEEIRVTIAAQACLLLLHSEYPRYPRLRRILVYPRTFVPTRYQLSRSFEIEDRPEPALGEAWSSGIVILSWDNVRAGAANPNDGRNVVLHEFAHVLDAEDGEFDGVPPLPTASAYRAWGYALSNRFARHQRLVRAGREGSVDPYGATNRAEFFAVATETFFEKPDVLALREPDLYRQLAAFYGFDPVAQYESPPPRGTA